MHIPHIRRGKVGLAALLGAALVATPLVATPAFAAPADVKTINLININDFHGRIDENTVKWAGTIEKLRADSATANATVDNSILLAAGDNFGASVYASSSQDENPSIDVLNALQLSASAVGNHEFDRGFADLTGRVTDRNNWDYLGANVYNKGTKTPALKEYSVVTTPNGVTVAVIGAVTQETPTLVSPAGVANLDFGDPVEAVNRVVGQLNALPAAEKPDVYVAEYHEGAADGTKTLAESVAASAAFANIVNNTSADVDAIFTGHTHQKYAYQSGARPVVQTGNYGENIGQVKLDVDTATDAVTNAVGTTTARATPVAPETSAQLDARLVSTYPRVSQVNDITKAALAAAKVTGDKPVASQSADITRAFTGTTSDDRASESVLGNLVADSLVDTLKAPALGGAEIGIVNPGGLRADLLFKSSSVGEGDGVITFAEANAVLPFVNNLWTTSLTGAQLKTVFEQQYQTDANGAVPSRPYLQLGLSNNVSYTYDPAAAQGSHITSISINGAPVDPTKSYRVGTFSFLTSGGDNFRELAKGTGARDSGLIDRDAWIGYLAKSSPVKPSFARRAVAASPLITTVLPQGTKSSITLSKLDLTSLGSPANTSVSAAFAGSAAKPVVTPVAGGSAVVNFTVPFDAPANATLVLTASPSNTVVRVPVTTSLTIDSNIPKISGENKVGATLKATVGTWDPRAVAMTFRWYADGKAIKGATSKSLKLTKAMKGKRITMRAVGKKAGYPTAIRYSAAPGVKVYLAIKKHPRPTISGTPTVGRTLTAIAHKWSPSVSHKYQWYRDGVALTKATKKTYKLVSGDRGNKITVKVFGIRSGYFTETETKSIQRIK